MWAAAARRRRRGRAPPAPARRPQPAGSMQLAFDRGLLLRKETMVAGQVKMLLVVLSLFGEGTSHGDGPAERKRRGDSFFLDGQFDGFALDMSPAPEDTAQMTTPSIRTNTTLPLRAGSSCESPDLGPRTPSNPYTCAANGAWVELFGQCSTSSGVWWAGIFPASAPPNMHTINPNDLPGNNTKSPWTPPFMVPAPLKFSSVRCAFNLSKSDNDDPMWRRWWVPNTRQPVVFILFNGSESSATEAARSDPITFADSGMPMHLRLARTRSASEMRVSWTSSCSQAAEVKWGASMKQLTHTAKATSATCVSQSFQCALERWAGCLLILCVDY